jgi:hypothetical protein
MRMAPPTARATQWRVPATVAGTRRLAQPPTGSGKEAVHQSQTKPLRSVGPGNDAPRSVLEVE